MRFHGQQRGTLCTETAAARPRSRLLWQSRNNCCLLRALPPRNRTKLSPGASHSPARDTRLHGRPGAALLGAQSRHLMRPESSSCALVLPPACALTPGEGATDKGKEKTQEEDK
ncbi:unnamed protein product [Pleuronectes platessa]|uniref:Uncharacterized protein n=1 Tax=Pleuronectes platessa TaxID=8262 RepID=A0A9N7Z922_PLEPL|nr:unnamed protein product [Pleuronectes platessa]